MDKPNIDVQSVLESPLFWGFLALVALAIGTSGKLSVAFSQGAFLAAFLLAIYALRKQSRLVLLSGSAAIGIVLFLCALYFRPDMVPSYTGTLIAPHGGILKGRETPREIEIGDSMATFIQGGPEGMPLFKFAKNSNLTIESKNGKLFVSTDIRDKKGNLIAEIIRNEWKVAPSPRTWDRNYNDNALEVRAPDGHIVLQVVLLADRVQIQGEWWLDAKHGIRFVSEGPGKAGIFERLPSRAPFPNEPQIKPMFAYPSNEHLGQLLKR